MRIKKPRTILFAAICLIHLVSSQAGVRIQERKTGEWQQFIWMQDEVRWKYLGTFLVYEANSTYRMKPVEQVRAADVTNSRGITAVRFSGSDWTFNSDWGTVGVGTLRLTKTGDGMYQGWSYLEGTPQYKNLWILVK